MFNHSSFIDLFLFCYCLKNPTNGVIAKEIFNYPIFGRMLRYFNAIPIDRGNRTTTVSSIQQAQETLRGETNIAVLPEGIRRTTGNLKRFKKGGFHLAINTQAWTVPIECVGAFEYKPKNRKKITREKIF